MSEQRLCGEGQGWEGGEPWVRMKQYPRAWAFNKGSVWLIYKVEEDSLDNKLKY